MDGRLWPSARDRVGDSVPVTKFSDFELRTAPDGATMTLGEVVDDSDLVPVVKQLRDEHAADISGTTSNENPHTRLRTLGKANASTPPTR
jgi:hypothetical protein